MSSKAIELIEGMVAQLRGEIQRYEGKVLELQSEIERLGKMFDTAIEVSQVKLNPDLVEALHHAADRSGKKPGEFAGELLARALKSELGEADTIAIDRELYQTLTSQAHGRGIPLYMLTLSSEFTEWLLRGLENDWW